MTSVAAKFTACFIAGFLILFIAGCSSGGGGNRQAQQLQNVNVPDLIGQTHAGAEASILAAGLRVGDVTDLASDTVPADHVMAQNPAANAVVTEGSRVHIVLSSGPATVAVPDVVGLTEAQATTDLLIAGLTAGNVTRQNDSTVPAGYVISQDPISGVMAASGSAVDLVVSLGPATIATPDVVGLNEAQAIADIMAAGLVSGAVTRQNDNTVPAGDVISQAPIAGTMVAPGSAVDLVVSLGPGTIPVPNVVGLSEANATTVITSSGLVVGNVSRVANDTVPVGDVISQSPLAGEMVSGGSSVDLVVSLGPATIPAPDVVGLSQAQATADILVAGLTVGIVSTQNDDTVPAGSVISQDPIAGTMVAAGSSIDLVVSLGPGTIAVPDVTGLTTAAATNELVSAGLSLGTVSNQHDASVPAGNVISSDPSAGTMVAPGSAVDLVVSLGPSTTTVPDVVGLTEAQATADIQAAGLVVGTVTRETHASVPLGDVVSQDPDAGLTVNEGSAVNLVVSLGP